ncbi:hypothetical protein pb186bvf_015608 [Paramecium bursaria]
MSGQRSCQIVGHQTFISSYICTHEQCDQQLRWLCQECMRKSLHNHQQQNQHHIMDKDEFIVFLDQRIKLLQQQIKDPQNLIKNYQDQLAELMQNLCSVIEYLDDARMVKNQIDDLQRMSQLAINSFYQIDNKDLCKIQKIGNIQIYDDDLFNNKLNNIINQFTQIMDDNKQIKQEGNGNKVVQKQTIIQEAVISNFPKYIEYLSLEQNLLIQTTQISQNEQYVALGGVEKQLQIYHLKSKKLLQTIKLDQPIQVAKFSNDSNCMYVGCQEGNLHSFDINNNFSQKYKKQIHKNNGKSNVIINLIEKQNQIVIVSTGDGSLIIIDLLQQKEISRLNQAHDRLIFGLDYNQSEDIIASSAFTSIKFFKGQDFQQIINNQNAHLEIIYQIQLIDKRLLSLGDERTLKIWFIDYKNGILVFLNQIQDQFDIRSFSSVLNNKQILLIYQDFQIIQQFNHTSGDYVLGNDTRQLNSMNYIIIKESCIYISIILQSKPRYFLILLNYYMYQFLVFEKSIYIKQKLQFNSQTIQISFKKQQVAVIIYK